LIASVVGTTGAAMILIRPLLRANAERAFNAHVVVFFIFLVCNIGGALSPLGDPPLFIGFLKGVSFFWTAQHLWLQTLIVAGVLLAGFVAVDLWYAQREPVRPDKNLPLDIRIHGLVNLVLIAGVVAALLGGALWH
jgi:Na+/H+ antiporter NhaD/arsenite permease-like protein